MQGRLSFSTRGTFRVPTPTVSVIDFTAISEKEVTRDEIREAMRQYAEGEMKGILAVTDEPLVSTDLKGTSYSSVFSAPDTLVIGNMVRWWPGTIASGDMPAERLTWLLSWQASSLQDETLLAVF